MKKICIVHFQELEKYPPAINLIRFLRLHSSSPEILVFTTTSEGAKHVTIEGVQIHRLVTWRKKTTRLSRTWKYILFNMSSFCRLVRIKPTAILYYESLSAGAALIYKQLINRNVEIFVHYHEYTSPREYETGMLFNKWMHHLELRWYSKTKWVSHTNNDRVKLFLADVNGHAPLQMFSIPNYPPKSWKTNRLHKRDGRIRFVYVGALSLETMYVREMVDFIVARSSECSWDIYSSNVAGEVMNYLASIRSNAVTFKGEVAYDQLPEILRDYDVGLVLYKGHIPNYVYNVPNKVFEYHVCGLDVWFPISMKSALSYQTVQTYPKIVAVDFNQLQGLDPDPILDRGGLMEKRYDFNCEDVLTLLADQLLASTKLNLHENEF